MTIYTNGAGERFKQTAAFKVLRVDGLHMICIRLRGPGLVTIYVTDAVLHRDYTRVE